MAAPDDVGGPTASLRGVAALRARRGSLRGVARDPCPRLAGPFKAALSAAGFALKRRPPDAPNGRLQNLPLGAKMEPSIEPLVNGLAKSTARVTTKLPLAPSKRPVPPVTVCVSTTVKAVGLPAGVACPST